MSTFNLDNWGDDEVVTSKESDFFKLPVGDVKVRILTDFHKVKNVWEGEYPNSKPLGLLQKGQKIKDGQSVKTAGWAWVIVRGDVDQMKIVTFPISIIAKVANLKKDDEYTWDEMPMPYDITIHNTGEGGDRYSITPSRTNASLTEFEQKQLEEKTPIEEIVQKIMDKQSGKIEESQELEYPESNGDPLI